jgi:hypothetical protein
MMAVPDSKMIVSERPLIFIGGMFRSGTTLLGKMLNAHPRIAIASDPYLPFFKALRSAIAAQSASAAVPATAPLADYYFDPRQIAIFNAVQQARLDLPLPALELPSLHAEIRRYSEPYAPRILPLIDSIQGNTFGQAFARMLDVLDVSYGKGRNCLLGFKEVWADEFIPCLARAMPKARFIQITRDPRGVCASKNVLPERYPWIFMARQWRKLTAAGWHYQHDPAFAKRILRVRFEDLVANPAAVAGEVCAFLDVSRAEEMIDPSCFVDGTGGPWMQNTSFGRGGRSFDADAAHRWRNRLAPVEIEFIESLCGPEMLLHGYELSGPWRPPVNGEIRAAPRVPDDHLAGWIKGLYPNDPLSIAVETTKEILRGALLRGCPHTEPDLEVIQGCFLFTDVYQAARRAI